MHNGASCTRTRSSRSRMIAKVTEKPPVVHVRQEAVRGCRQRIVSGAQLKVRSSRAE